MAPVINNDLPCQTCQYNLRGLPTDAKCPECGEPVQSTIAFAAASGMLPDDRAQVLRYGHLAGQLGVTIDGVRFVLDAYHSMYRDLRPGAHVDAATVCRSVRDYAVAYFHDPAEAVELLTEWGIRRSEDVGRIVFGLVELGEMMRSETDRPEDFGSLFVTESYFPSDLWLNEREANPDMQVFTTIAELRKHRRSLGTVALVPTMGALHPGHMSLITEAKKRAPHVAVSIFVNPTQFGPKEDFTKYPRPIEKDLAMCREAGVSFVFNPPPEEMYPSELPKVVIDLPELTNVLEGAHRPGHFNGVCQVVAKLFNIVQPDVACFGQKDFQQLRILTAMVESLDWPIEMVACPTLRDPDGLAMSSRNQYLSADERERALAISRGLFAARDAVTRGARNAPKLVQMITQELLTAQMQIDYVAAVDPRTLQTVTTMDQPTTFAVAARVGTTRLIDNVLITP